MSGETMRDRFAMAALTGLIAAGNRYPAESAYHIADALIAARGGDAPQPASDAVKQQMLAALRAHSDYMCRMGWTAPFVGGLHPQASANWQRVIEAIAAGEKEQSA